MFFRTNNIIITEFYSSCIYKNALEIYLYIMENMFNFLLVKK